MLAAHGCAAAKSENGSRHLCPAVNCMRKLCNAGRACPHQNFKGMPCIPILEGA